MVDKDKQNPSYNVCPTRFAPTYRTNKDNQAIVQYMSWGLIPFWTKKKADAKYVIQKPVAFQINTNKVIANTKRSMPEKSRLLMVKDFGPQFVNIIVVQFQLKGITNGNIKRLGKLKKLTKFHIF